MVFRTLEARVANDGARPLLTWYQPSSGARVEFSAITLANWVDKTVNLLGDLGWESGARVGAPLLQRHPGHWVSAVWALATWATGGELVIVPVDELTGVDVAVLGPDAHGPVPGADTIACSLHPLGLGLAEPIAGVIDYREVLSQPDLHSPALADPDPVWLDGRTPSSERRLVHPEQAGDFVSALLAAILGGGSVVVVDGPATPEQLNQIAGDERVAGWQA